jgi:hypothetical protein
MFHCWEIVLLQVTLPYLVSVQVLFHSTPEKKKHVTYFTKSPLGFTDTPSGYRNIVIPGI